MTQIPKFEDMPKHAQDVVGGLQLACDVLVMVYEDSPHAKEDKPLELMMQNPQGQMFRISISKMSKDKVDNYLKHHEMVEPISGRQAKDVIKETTK